MLRPGAPTHTFTHAPPTTLRYLPTTTSHTLTTAARTHACVVCYHTRCMTLITSPHVLRNQSAHARARAHTHTSGPEAFHPALITCTLCTHMHAHTRVHAHVRVHPHLPHATTQVPFLRPLPVANTAPLYIYNTLYRTYNNKHQRTPTPTTRR